MSVVRNYTGKDQRFVCIKDGKLQVARCYVAWGQAYLNMALTPGCTMDGVPVAILADAVQGLPLPGCAKVRPEEVDNEVYIVRKDVALAMLQLPNDLRSRCLVPFDPVMVPEEMRFATDIRECDCRLASGLLNDPEGQSLRSQGYVCYGYRRLVALSTEDIVPMMPLIFPTLESDWPADAERREEFRLAVARLRKRFNLLPDDGTLSDLGSVIALAEANSDLFSMSDTELSRLLLRLEKAEHMAARARNDSDAV